MSVISHLSESPAAPCCRHFASKHNVEECWHLRRQFAAGLHSETCAGNEPQCLHSAHPAHVWRIDALLMPARCDALQSGFRRLALALCPTSFRQRFVRTLPCMLVGCCACLEPGLVKPVSRAFVAAAFGCVQQIPLNGGPCKLNREHWYEGYAMQAWHPPSAPPISA